MRDECRSVLIESTRYTTEGSAEDCGAFFLLMGAVRCSNSAHRMALLRDTGEPGVAEFQEVVVFDVCVAG